MTDVQSSSSIGRRDQSGKNAQTSWCESSPITWIDTKKIAISVPAPSNTNANVPVSIAVGIRFCLKYLLSIFSCSTDWPSLHTGTERAQLTLKGWLTFLLACALTLGAALAISTGVVIIP